MSLYTKRRFWPLAIVAAVLVGVICIIPLARNQKRRPDEQSSLLKEDSSYPKIFDALDPVPTRYGRREERSTPHTHPAVLKGDLQVRAGYFRFANHAARKIYHGGAPDIELQGDLFVHRFFNPWMNINYVWREGRSDPLSDKTELKLVTMSAGSYVQFSSRRYPLKFYLGIGLAVAYLHLRDHSDYLPHHTDRWSIGVVGKSGLLINFHRCLLNPFFDYYFQPASRRSTLSESQVNVGGFRVGLGLGYFF